MFFKEFKKIIILSVTVCSISLAFFSPMIAAQTPPPSLKDSACAGLNSVDPTQGCSSKGNDINTVIKAAVEVLSVGVGIVAVIMIIVAGFKYVTSSGDSNKVGSAKTTLVYALVGLAIAALAQTLVYFTLSTAKPPASCPSGQTLTSNSKCVSPKKK